MDLIRKKWWKEAVVYQIYPRSFMDSNGDGIGDLQGIMQKLDYLQDLGINVIWLSPIYSSPNDDNGYDISDYQNIMAEFGTLADFDALLTQCHQRNIRLIMDLVINHTSDEHSWFIESRSAKNSPKRDWYIWQEGIEGHEPNNWESIFKGSVWQYDKQTEQYYFHLFSKRQPDINWQNKQVRHALYQMICWWLDKGIDGFRLDAISHIKKAPGFPNMPNPKQLNYIAAFPKVSNYPGILDYIDDLCQQTFNRYDIMTVGEANGVNYRQAPDWVDEKNHRLNMLFQFEHLALWDDKTGKKFNLNKFKTILSRWQHALHKQGWNALFIENHDLTRVTSRWVSDSRYWYESATAFAAVYFLMQGTPFIYQGQEIGMTNSQFTTIEDFNDISDKNRYCELKKSAMSERSIIELLANNSRDNARTPMQWSDAQYAGFSNHKPWIKLNANYHQINVAQQQKDKHSIYHFYQKLIQLRRTREVIVYGDYQLILKQHQQIFAYLRQLGEQKIVVIVNLSEESANYYYNKITLHHRFLLLSNRHVAKHKPLSKIRLEPYEVRIYQVD